jgi:predicted phage terminase large subunit-like protein
VCKLTLGELLFFFLFRKKSNKTRLNINPDKLLIQVNKELCKRSYYQFLLQAWSVLEPTTELISNWHIEYICNQLQNIVMDVIEGKEREHHYIINVPPRSLKSYMTSIMLNAWAWTINPSLKFITASYAQDLATDLARKTRNLIQSEWYQERWGELYQLSKDENLKMKFSNTMHGERQTTSVGGGVTGKGADIIIIDDAQDPRRANSEVERENTLKWYNETLSSRHNNPKVGTNIIVMQRLHENDLTGYLLEHNKESYYHINLPAIESDEISPIELKEQYQDGLLMPDRFSQNMLDNQKKAMGSYGFASQYLQKPYPDEGYIIKKDWWNKYTVLPEKFDYILHSWDMAFKETNQSDYVVGQVWGKLGANIYLLDMVRQRLDFPKTLNAVKRLVAKYPDYKYILIEEKANGAAIIQSLKKQVPAIIPIIPKESKEARVHAVAPIIEAGNVYIPVNASWIGQFINECAGFPKSTHDDIVDAMSQALNRVYNSAKRVVLG